ncbi:50S ribosomal protein L22 [Candidatus Dojkabacteria bacterium]|nr:50S ribosomal protein L22 [Candidatus Dojkabacteria bacterium]
MAKKAVTKPNTTSKTKKVVSAYAKNVLSTPQKTRLLADLVRGRKVIDAENILKLTHKKAAGILLKLIKSAASSAENNNNMDIKNLVVKSILVDEGLKLPRFKYVSRGNVARKKKRRSHILVELIESN